MKPRGHLCGGSSLKQMAGHGPQGGSLVLLMPEHLAQGSLAISCFEDAIRKDASTNYHCVEVSGWLCAFTGQHRKSFIRPFGLTRWLAPGYTTFYAHSATTVFFHGCSCCSCRSWLSFKKNSAGTLLSTRDASAEPIIAMICKRGEKSEQKMKQQSAFCRS